MTNGSIKRAATELEILEHDFVADFVTAIEARLRCLTDREVNALYLSTHTDWHEGLPIDVWTAVLLPVIEREWDLRCNISVVPYVGPVIAPELYQKGGGHYVPF